MASRRPHSGSSQGWTGRFGRVAGAPKPTAVNGSRRTLRYRRMCDIDSGHELWTPDERTEGPLAWTVAETLGSATRWPPTPGLHRSARAVLHSLLHRTRTLDCFVAPCPSPDHANPRRDCRPGGAGVYCLVGSAVRFLAPGIRELRPTPDRDGGWPTEGGVPGGRGHTALGLLGAVPAVLDR
jgi:hypothetical protein